MTTLQIDPRHELVWRSPSSVQVGADRALVVLDDITPAEERMLSALVVGVTEPGFDLLSQPRSVDGGSARDLLEALRPALRTSEHTTSLDPAIRVFVSGSGPTAAAVMRLLLEAGVTAFAHTALAHDALGRDPQPEPRSTDLAVIVDHFVVDPEVRGYWLRRDVPHLALVIGDAQARIGPFIEPGRGPCLWCLDRVRADLDPAWPAIASQLLGRRSSADRGVVAVETAAIAVRRVLERIAAPRHLRAIGRTP